MTQPTQLPQTARATVAVASGAVAVLALWFLIWGYWFTLTGQLAAGVLSFLAALVLGHGVIFIPRLIAQGEGR